jgi:hypothetical protein
MKPIQYFAISVSMAILSISCEKMAKNFKLNDSDPQIVLNALFDPDTVFSVHVCRSIGVLEPVEKVIPIENAIVEVFENGALLARLDQYKNGNYFHATAKPEPGKTYTLNVAAEGFNDAKALVKIPQTGFLLGLDTASTVWVTDYGNRNNVLEIKLNVKNNPALNEFFMLEVYRFEWGYIRDYSDNSWGEPVKTDSGYYKRYEQMQTIDPQATLGLSIYNSEITDFEDYEDIYKYGYKIVFTDRLMKKENENISIGIYAQYYDFEDKYDSIVPVYVVCYSLSEEYANYLKSHKIYYGDPFDQFFTEKASVFSNVENGMGIVAAQTPNRITFNVRVHELPDETEYK